MVMPSAPRTRKASRRKPGRPTSFRPEYAEQAFKLCLLGATDAELADFFHVRESTINNWKTSQPTFLESLKKGKRAADAEVANRLYRRALGYSHRAVKILTVAIGNNGGSVVEQVPYTERYPPDTTAAIFWLKNRQPALWRDKQAVEHSGQIAGSGVLIVPAATDAAAWESEVAARQAALAARPGVVESPSAS